jgi:tetratricopeptide (TPR) repeat protein
VKKKRKNKRTSLPKRSIIKKPLLSLAMMVKNEEDFLEDALKSARGFCDELIVVDTGSTDRTVEIAHDLGAKVSYFEWCDSFSKARNETLRQSSGEWVAILDADERFVGSHPERVRPFLIPRDSYPYQAIMLNVINTRLDGSPISSFFSVRLFPNDPRLGYSGRVHNRFGPMEENAPKIEANRYTGLEIVHLGYDPELYEARKKAARSLPLIEATVREEPDNHQHRFYLGREYLLLGRLDEAHAALTLAFEGILATQNGPLVDTATHLMQTLTSSGESPANIIKVGQRALAQAPQHPDLWFEVGRALISAAAFEQAADSIARALTCLDQTVGDQSQTRLTHRRWEAHELLGKAYWGLGRYPDAYQHYLRALPNKPQDSSGWPVLLNSVCALAIELKDQPRVPGLIDRLISREDTPLGMFFFELDRLASAEGLDVARRFLIDAQAKCQRIARDPEYLARAEKLGVQ